jgi:hypothetical protein
LLIYLFTIFKLLFIFLYRVGEWSDATNLDGAAFTDISQPAIVKQLATLHANQMSLMYTAPNTVGQFYWSLRMGSGWNPVPSQQCPNGWFKFSSLFFCRIRFDNIIFTNCVSLMQAVKWLEQAPVSLSTLSNSVYGISSSSWPITSRCHLVNTRSQADVPVSVVMSSRPSQLPRSIGSQVVIVSGPKTATSQVMI